MRRGIPLPLILFVGMHLECHWHRSAVERGKLCAERVKIVPHAAEVVAAKTPSGGFQLNVTLLHSGRLAVEITIRQRQVFGKHKPEYDQIAHRRILSGRGILRNHRRNNNSPETGNVAFRLTRRRYGHGHPRSVRRGEDHSSTRAKTRVIAFQY
jgi:hypothetical protein